MDDNRSKTFSVGKYKLTIPDPKDPAKRVPLESFELRECIGDDMIAAAERAGASNVSLKNAMIAEAFIAVNGESVVAPFVGWSKWPLKVRDFVAIAFARMNDAATSELVD